MNVDTPSLISNGDPAPVGWLLLLLITWFGAASTNLLTLDPTSRTTGRPIDFVLINLVSPGPGWWVTFTYFGLVSLIGTVAAFIIGDPEIPRDALILGFAWTSLVPAPISQLVTRAQATGQAEPLDDKPPISVSEGVEERGADLDEKVEQRDN